MSANVSIIGIGAHVAGYDVLVLEGDELLIHRDGETRRFPVPNYGTSLAELAARPGARIAFGRFPESGDEVIYVFDQDDDDFGYACNLTCPWCSEWGYAPF